MILVRWLWTRCTFFLFLVTVATAANSFEGQTIVSIQFDPAEQPLESAELHDILPLKTKTPLRMADVRAAIERLYATGRYADIRVDAEPAAGGVLVRIVTRNRWFIGRVAAEGAVTGPPNSGQLVNATRLDLGEPYSPEKLEQARADVRKLLEENGLYLGDVLPRFDYDPATQQVNLTFVIGSSRRARFTSPELKGDLKMPADTVVAATKWRRWLPLRWLYGTWKPVTQARTRHGVESVAARYQKDKRLEAKVNLESMTHDSDTNTVKPTLHIDAGPKVEIKTVGVKIPAKKLQEYVPVYEEHTVDRDLLVEGERNLVDYLQSQGFFEAEAVFKQQRVRNDQSEIDYVINPGKRHRLVYIEIRGNHYFTTETIRERMFLQTASLLQFRHGRYSASLLRQDTESITNLYKSNGFREAVVSSRTADDYQGKSGDIAVFIEIQEGPQWFVASLDLQGVAHLSKEAILATLSSTAGQPFTEFNVAVDRDTILARYFSEGFPNANFEWSSTPAAQANQVNLKYVVKEGGQQFVREVLTDGARITRSTLINRNILLNPGEPLSPIKMTETQRRLYDLGVFAKVDTAIQDPEGETQSKYVLYQMYEASRYSVAAGFGAYLGKIGGCTAGCLSAPAGATGFAPRVSLDVTRLNMFGLGHSLSFRSRVSTLDRRGLLNYSAPRIRNREGLNLSFTALWDDIRDVKTFTARRIEGSVQLSQRLSKATTFFYRYSYRRVSVGSLNISPLLAPSLAAAVRVGMPSFNVIQDRRDDPVETHKGIYNTIDVGLADRVFGSQRNFSRFLARNATYHPLGKKVVLARDTSIGVLHAYHFTGEELEAIPLAERFFAGGGTSHRGFPENQAGPRDLNTGFPLGGTALLFNQTELRFPLIGDNIRGVLFHDAGNVYSSLGNISFGVIQSFQVEKRNLHDFDYMVHAAGFGVRYKTPVGPVRVDLGYSINSPRFFGFKGSQSDFFNAGPTPCTPVPGMPLAQQCVVQRISHFQFFFSIGQTF
jgi:outer membrane protein insertion porin family